MIQTTDIKDGIFGAAMEWEANFKVRPVQVILPHVLYLGLIHQCQDIHSMGHHAKDTISEFMGMRVYRYDGPETVFS